MSRTPEHLFDQSVSIHRPEVSLDALGSAITTWPTYRASQQARIQALRGQKGEHFGREGIVLRWRIYMAGDAPVRPGDRLQWRSHVMDVQSVNNVHEQNRLLVIEAQEIK